MSMKNRHVLREAVRHLILIILALYTLAPLLFLFVNAFKSNNEIIASPVALPEHWTLQYIKTANGSNQLWKSSGTDLYYYFFLHPASGNRFLVCRMGNGGEVKPSFPTSCSSALPQLWPVPFSL